MDPDKVRLPAFMVQVMSTMTIAYLITLTGLVYAWPSYCVENFRSNETVLSHPMSSWEVSLLGGLTNVGALIATPFCGYAVDTFGRKYAALMFGLPFVVAWSTISLTTNVTLIIGASFLAGFGAAGQAVASIYISEIAQDSIRGALTSTTVSGYFLGLLFSYTLGGYLTYSQVIYTHLTMSVSYLVLLSFLKESPVYLMQIGKEEEAKKSIAFYRYVEYSSKEVEVEIRKIKLQLDPRIDFSRDGNFPTLIEGARHCDVIDIYRYV